MTVHDDLSGMGSAREAWTRALARTATVALDPDATLPVLIDGLADRFGTAPALLGAEEELSYAELAARTRRYARWALAERIEPGDRVGLLAQNSPDYLAIWLGLARSGAVVSLLNTHLVGDPLAHAVNAAQCTHLIVAAELASNLDAVRSRFSPIRRVWSHGAAPGGAPRIDLAIQSLAAEPLTAAECPLPSLRDDALLIYTSGTTGLPKAARVSHERLIQWCQWFGGMLNAGPADRMYDCLPMYHSVGGVVAPGAMLVSGGSVVIRERFSLSRFWDDVVDSGCTLFQYIGELCRYLQAGPPHPRERSHALRVACGNGLRADVWARFQARFAIPRILEFYAATEANFSLYNCEGKVGAIGRIPAFLAHRVPVALIRIDADGGEPQRTADGLCVRCEANEPGEAVCAIGEERSSPGNRFEGYTDAGASAQKVLRNVLAPGDAWYRSGDLMKRDRSGYFYFIDRLGATFRWKGENVSTAEVADALLHFPGIAQAIVYGVQVPGAEGRAGMAALVTPSDLDLARLRLHLLERLPDYARPRFLRIVKHIAMTATFKPRVHEYAAAGFDATVIADPLYVDDPDRATFVRLDADTFRRIQSASLR